MRNAVLNLVGAVLFASSISPAAFPNDHDRAHTVWPYGGGSARNAYALPYLPRLAVSGAPGDINMRESCASIGMYADNDPNVYRDGECRNDINPHGG